MHDGEEAEFNNIDDVPITEILGLGHASQRKHIRQELTDPYNRLHSIAEDAEFVETIARTYPDFLLVPNLRCGLWYVSPEAAAASPSVYFKSTDGHAGQWSFSLRRANISLTTAVEKHGGVIVVDSTRRGKRFPDALSKTLPIWCAVLNRAICLRYNKGWPVSCLDLFVPAISVSESERSQIAARLPVWAAELAASSYTLPCLGKPLRPLFMSPASHLPPQPVRENAFADFHPIICLSASRVTTGGSAERNGSFNYVPGSGDDHEAWSPNGFSPAIFWHNKREILASNRSGLRFLLERLTVETDSMFTTPGQRMESFTIGSTAVHLSAVALSSSQNMYCINCRSNLPLPEATPKAEYVYVPTGPKQHIALFSAIVDRIIGSASAALSAGHQIWVTNEGNDKNATDVSVGIVLVLLVRCYDNEQQLRSEPCKHYTKEDVRRRLEWIVSSSSGVVNPSRDILKKVNTVVCK